MRRHIPCLIQMSIDTKAIKEQILVVCLNGIRVTDEYECIVCPNKQEGPWLNSRTSFVESRQYKALLEVADELNVRLGRDDSVVFLSDNLRESLYPFYVIKDLNKFNRLHLCAMSPFLVEPKWKIKAHRELLSDLSKLTSVLYFNSHEYLNRDNTKAQKIMSAFDFYIACFPKVLLHVGDMTEVSYYDFEKDAYVPVEEGHSRFRMATDGMGVSTLVVFSGCPLYCKYCINQECHEDLIFIPDFLKPPSYKEGCYDEKHRYTNVHSTRASYEPDELLEVLRKDEIYYLMTEGGVVFGGGEPLLYSEFIHEVCQRADKRWKKRIETSLNMPWENVELLVDDLDEWIIDIKDIDPVVYKEYTGFDNKNVIDNLLRLRDKLKPEMLRIRVPRIRGYNTDEQVEKSVLWVRHNIKVEPEVFDYVV